MNMAFTEHQYRESASDIIARTVRNGAAIALIMLVAAATARAENLVALAGNHPDAAAQLAATGNKAPLDRALQMEIYLKPRNQAQLQQLIEEQQDPSSPNYHKWLTPDEYAQKFGPSADDISQVTQWLTSQGFTVTYVSAQQGRIKFEGSVDTAQTAFNVDIKATFNGKRYSNVEDPQIPSSLAPKIGYLAGLDNLHANVWQALIPTPPNNTGTTTPYFGPNDIQTFNDEAPLLNDGYNGSGQCIALSEGSDIDQASLGEFNTQFSLPAFSPGTNFISVFPDGSPDPPGSEDGGDPYGEAMVDVEYAHGIAPGATIVLYAANAGADASDPTQALVDTAIAATSDTTNHCATLAISWAQCGEPASFYTNLDQSAFQKGIAEGQTIFVATGDVGATELVFNAETGGCEFGNAKGIEEIAGSPNITAVGATMFQPTYDSDGNDTSTLTNTTQSVWNFSLDFLGFLSTGASTGGYSKIFSLPTWQDHVAGISGKFRAVPDLVLGGGDLGGSETITDKNDKVKVTGKVFDSPGYWVCLDSGYANGVAEAGGTECTADGGTSFVPPQYAGLFAIIAQKTGKPQGAINRELYAMAQAKLKDLSSVGIVDITTGNNTLKPVAGYPAKKGYDEASGWGSIDMTNFVNSFISFTQ
jgi:subtilase family serine protease